MLRLLARSVAPRPPAHWFSTTAAVLDAPRTAQSTLAEQRKRREKFAYLKQGTQRRRLDGKTHSGRSSGGQTQQFMARMRRARDQRNKHDQAREFAAKHSETAEQRAMADARILRQRAKQLKSRGAPGLGFTPARFKLMHIENESGSGLNAISGGKRTLTIKELEESVRNATFATLGLRSDVAEAALSMLQQQTAKEIRPTDIQALGIPEILGRTHIKGKHSHAPSVFLAAETGSGKTLAYALPVISQLKQAEEAAQRRLARPRALVVVPSRELVVQVVGTFKRLAHTAKVRALGIHLGVTRRRIRDLAAQGPIDVLVTTPGAALRYMQRDPLLSPADVRHLVVDEADSLMDPRSFGEQMTRVLQLVHGANQTQKTQEQAVFVSATLPKLIREQIIRRYPDVVHVTTPSLHRAPQKLSQSFIDVSREFQGHRLNALWYVLRTAAADKHLIVFCNNKKHANLVHRQMYARGIPALLLVGSRPDKSPEKDRARAPKTDADADADDVRAPRRPASDADAWDRATWYTEQPAKEPKEEPTKEPKAEDEEAEPISGADLNDLHAPVPHYDRTEVLNAFYSSDPVPAHLLPRVAKGEVVADDRKILVCTDLASRGLDTTCVTHVVLFDFPTTAIDYLHRSGRTARAGSKGKVTALVGKKDRRLADQIRLAIRQGGVIN